MFKPATSFALTALVLTLSPAVASAQLATLTVRVSGADPAGGTGEISVFNSADTFMKEPFLQWSGPVGEDGSLLGTFAAVPTGDYAAVVVHDANDNGKLDRGFLGFGGESYGWSNNPTPWFGWPDFEEVKFAVDQDTEIEISLD